MGQTGLAGSNTVSFDPASTLVRPLMRILHGPEGERYCSQFKPDDVIVVPSFGCAEEDSTVYEALSDEMDKVGLVGGEDPRKLPLCAQMVNKICTYFGMASEDCVVSLTWHRDDQDSAVFQGKASSSSDSACSASLCFGSPGQLHYEISGPADAVQLSCDNGHLVLVARDVELEWERSEPNRFNSHWTCTGQFLITVSGPSSMLTEELRLAPKQDAATDSAMAAARLSGQSVPSGVCRPTMRLIVARPSMRYEKAISHDDVVIIPDFFCAGEDLDVYYQLLKEMRETQAEGGARADWVSWHGGAHLLTKAPEGSLTYNNALDRVRECFAVENNNEQGMRFNWYRDGSDWKPFHHDSAAFNPQRAAQQNCSIGMSFGSTRELAFRHAKTKELIYIPMTNGMLFYFGRDVNIRWQHAINALPSEDQDGKGRISVVLWGLCTKTFEEEGSPAMLPQDRGPASGNDRRPQTGGEQVCRNFQNRGVCDYGDRCRFSHVAPDRSRYGQDRRREGGRPQFPGEEGTRGACRNFQQRGECSFGDRCKFSHGR